MDVESDTETGTSGSGPLFGQNLQVITRVMVWENVSDVAKC